MKKWLKILQAVKLQLGAVLLADNINDAILTSEQVGKIEHAKYLVNEVIQEIKSKGV